MASVVDICNGALNQLEQLLFFHLQKIQRTQDFATQDIHKLETHYLDHILGTVYRNE